MPLDLAIQRAIIAESIQQFERLKFQQETLGSTWQTIGNAQHAETCAKAASEATMAIAELRKKLEALED